MIQLRDKDAKHLIETRDVKLIEKVFEKIPTRVDGVQNYFKEPFKLKSRKYRAYSEAYFEEIILESNIHFRITKFFRENFLKN
jgi:hypothetical protein